MVWANFVHQAYALRELGAVRRLTGDYPAAAQAQEQALDIYRDIGNRNGEAEALNDKGTLHRVSGDLAQAQRCHQQALDLARAIASSRNQAHALAWAAAPWPPTTPPGPRPSCGRR